MYANYCAVVLKNLLLRKVQTVQECAWTMMYSIMTQHTELPEVIASMERELPTVFDCEQVVLYIPAASRPTTTEPCVAWDVFSRRLSIYNDVFCRTKIICNNRIDNPKGINVRNALMVPIEHQGKCVGVFQVCYSLLLYLFV